jgi:MoaA/NifB/PqqE/SkfB family radical SAM enzyme
MVNDLFLKNKELNTSEIKGGKIILSSKLTSLICSLTNRCNLHCIMCDTWRTPWEIPKNTYKEVHSLLPYLEHAIWLGGEVFLSEYFGELLEETKKYPHLKQRINTNGIFITDEWAEKLFQNNVELIYSIDGATKETYEYVRKGADFEGLIRSINAVRNIKKKYGGEKFSLRMNAVIMKSNYKEIEKLVDFAREHDFDLVQLMPIAGEDTEEHIFSSKFRDEGILKYIDSAARSAQEKARLYDIEFLNSLPAFGNSTRESEPCDAEKDNRGLFCYLPWQQILIYPDGNVRFGCFCDEPIGNVLENTLEEIWNSDKAREYRQRIISNDYKGICSQRCIQGKISIKLRRIGEADICS